MCAMGVIFFPKRETTKKLGGLRMLATIQHLDCKIMSQSASALHAIPMGNPYWQLFMKTIIPQVFYHPGHAFHVHMTFENSNF